MNCGRWVMEGQDRGWGWGGGSETQKKENENSQELWLTAVHPFRMLDSRSFLEMMGIWNVPLGLCQWLRMCRSHGPVSLITYLLSLLLNHRGLWHCAAERRMLQWQCTQRHSGCHIPKSDFYLWRERWRYCFSAEELSGTLFDWAGVCVCVCVCTSHCKLLICLPEIVNQLLR